MSRMSLLEFFLARRRRREQRDPHRLVSRLSATMLPKVQQRKAVRVAGRKRDLLAGALPGERWVVRCWLPDGLATDVIGWIEALDATSVLLSSIDQQLHVIERSKIIAARH